MPTPITVEQAHALVEELYKQELTKLELVRRYERLAYPNGEAHKSDEQEIALKLYGRSPATKEEIRIAIVKLIRKGVPCEGLKTLVDK